MRLMAFRGELYDSQVRGILGYRRVVYEVLDEANSWGEFGYYDLVFEKVRDLALMDYSYPAARKPLYEAQYSDFLRRKDTGLREFWRNWRNCAKMRKFGACVDTCAKISQKN